MNKSLDELRTELVLASTQFSRMMHQLAPQHRQQSGVSGWWSPKDVIAHLMGWDAALHAFITHPEGFDPEPLYDIQAFNAASVAARHDQSWEATIDEWHHCSSDLHTALTTVTADMRIYARVCGWVQGRQDDYAHHTRQLEVWIASHGDVSTLNAKGDLTTQ